MLNRKLLNKILKTPTTSYNEDLMVDLVKMELDKMNIKYVSDEIGNIYSIKPNTIMLSAHMDTVGSKIAQMRLPFINFGKGFIIGTNNIGADDKNGIYLILNALKTHKNISFCFSVQEEVGAIGARKVALENHENLVKCNYCLVLDRMGGDDLICSNNDYGTKSFEKFLLKRIGKYGFKNSTGTFSDANIWKNYISCANLSVGYYNPHTDNEYIDMNDLLNTQKAIDYILKNDKGEKFVKTYNNYNGYYSGYSSDHNSSHSSYYQKRLHSGGYNDKIEGDVYSYEDWEEMALEMGVKWLDLTTEERRKFKIDTLKTFNKSK